MYALSIVSPYRVTGAANVVMMALVALLSHLGHGSTQHQAYGSRHHSQAQLLVLALLVPMALVLVPPFIGFLVGFSFLCGTTSTGQKATKKG